MDRKSDCMKKKFFLLIIIIPCLLISGCKDHNEGKIANTNNEVEESTIKIFSNDKRLVFYNTENYLVFDYQDDLITGYKVYMDYETIDSAKNTLDIIKVNYSSDESVKSVDREGQYIVITYTDEYVKNTYTTKEELYKSLSDLKEVKE